MRGIVFRFFMVKLSPRFPSRGTFLVIFRKNPGLSSPWLTATRATRSDTARTVRDLMLMPLKLLLAPASQSMAFIYQTSTPIFGVTKMRVVPEISIIDRFSEEQIKNVLN